MDPGAGLVEQDHPGVRHQGAAELEEAGLASREVARRLLAEFREPEEVEHLDRLVPEPALLGAHRAPAPPVVPEVFAQLAAGDHHQVLEHRHATEGARDLEGADESPMERPVRGLAGDVHAVEHDASRGRGERARDHVENRGLAGPRWGR